MFTSPLIEYAGNVRGKAFRVRSVHIYLQVLLQELVGGGTSALVAAERVALALLQADPRQALKAVVLEERVE